MKFNVTWLPEAIEEYFELWSNVEYREAVSAAGATIDKVLSEQPSGVGESRANNLRIYFESPLAVNYRVDLPAGQVEIATVWYFKKRKS